MDIQIRIGGFRLNFKNGYSIDVINGFGSYTENYCNTKVRENKEINSNTCEIAIVYKKYLVDVFNWGNTVKGNVTVDELVDYINKTKNLKGE